MEKLRALKDQMTPGSLSRVLRSTALDRKKLAASSPGTEGHFREDTELGLFATVSVAGRIAHAQVHHTYCNRLSSVFDIYERHATGEPWAFSPIGCFLVVLRTLYTDLWQCKTNHIAGRTTKLPNRIRPYASKASTESVARRIRRRCEDGHLANDQNIGERALRGIAWDDDQLHN